MTLLGDCGMVRMGIVAFLMTTFSRCNLAVVLVFIILDIELFEVSVFFDCCSLTSSSAAGYNVT